LLTPYKNPTLSLTWILEIMETSRFFEVQPEVSASYERVGAPDMFSYRLTLSDGTRQKTMAFNDMTAPNSLQPLLALLRKLAIDQRLQRK
jgi:hypothetical protein